MNKTIVGTLYYMSPEQLQAQADGRELDARSNIFSFGFVLPKRVPSYDRVTQFPGPGHAASGE